VKRPDAVAAGTVVAIVVEVTVLTAAGLTLSRNSSFAKVGSKFVPTRFTIVPATPLDGLKLVIVGTPLLEVTVKGELPVAVPLGLVTEIVPVVAAVGTVAWI
jgi:hypothetical protein